MKCPICGEEYSSNFDWCYTCGFNRMKNEFINENEHQNWIKETVEPCKAVYLTACESYDELDEQYSELQEEYDELQERYDELKEMYDTRLAQLENKIEMFKSIGGKPEPIKKEGWNYTDLVPHPNYAKCSYTGDVFEIYNVSGKGDENCYKIQFLAKMLSLSQWGNGSGRVRFKWRVKDKDGVIVLTNVWCKEGLLVGDVIRGEIVLNNVGDHLYTLDFINA